jgi:hypothetical protein
MVFWNFLVVPEIVKATFSLSATAKYRLASLKARLRRNGIVETESSLVERLLSPESISALEDALRGLTGRKTAK